MITTNTSAGRLWPWFVALLLALTAGAQGVLVWAATHDRAFAIEPDYYKKAVAWDSSMALARENAALAWTASAQLDRGSTGSAALRLTLRDSLGAPVRGARVRVTAVHNLEAARPTSASLHDDGDGTYSTTFATARPGLWEVRVDAHVAGHRFTPVVHADLAR